MKILIKNTTIVTMNPRKEILIDADILIVNNKIKKISKNIKAKAAKIINGKNKIALPGLINAHTHAAMTLFRGFADDLSLKIWLENYIWPAEAKLTPDDVYWGALLACAEMIRSGITCFNDMYWHSLATAEAIEKSGLRGCVSSVIVGLKKGWEDDLEEGSIKISQKYPTHLPSRIKIFLGPHAPYSCDEKVLKEVIKIGKKLKMGIHIHLAETKAEEKKQVRQLEKIGLFALPTIAAHGVWLTKNEMAVLAKRKVSIAHCPTSNLKLASGRADISGLIKAGINVCLGTDGAASNNRLDLFSEMKLSALLAKEKTNDPSALPAKKALEMATLGGSRALGLEKEIGSLEVGKKADLILVDTRAPHLQPIYHLVSHLVYAATAADVSTTIVDGKILMENRKLKVLDESKIIKKCQEISKKFLVN